jgi:hypothetical protein
MQPLTLTKSRFAMALDCPRKLDYLRDDAFVNARANDDFLTSLAEGGQQVGALARLLFPRGHLVADLAEADQLLRTADLLKQPEVTIFEGTIRHEKLLVRCDVLEKRGNSLNLIEVKAKGFEPGVDYFRSRKPGSRPIMAAWEPYLYDVAFQTYVLRLAFPSLTITPYLMLLDKTAVVTVPGLNSMLPVSTVGRRVSVHVSADFDIARIQPPVLKSINVQQEVDLILRQPVGVAGMPSDFGAFVASVAGTLGGGGTFPVNVTSTCKACEFYVDPADETPTRRSGWGLCMEVHTAKPTKTARRDTVFGLYRLGSAAVDRLLASEPIALAELPESVLAPQAVSHDAITSDQRRHLQWAEAHDPSMEPFVLRAPLQAELRGWHWPLHFIDFETTRPALPYHAGRTPYDQVLFQFSHHVLDREGRLHHRTQAIEATPGVAPSVPVLRALHAALGETPGTVIHWWTHERTVLSDIRRQILEDKPADQVALCAFIDSLLGTDAAPGRLADLGKLVSRTVFYPGTGGSSSIKKVLPAALRHSAWLRGHYASPVYGTAAMPSHNFKDWRWVIDRDGQPLDPYALLAPLFADPVLAGAVERAETDEDGANGAFVANGGAAIVAYDRLQRPDLAASEREQIQTQLLRYCELDTLAMVMVYQSLTSPDGSHEPG